MVVAITSTPDAVIGRYGLSMQLSSEYGSISHPLGKCMLLFNPWISDDEVHMPDEDERNEYVLNDSGILYLGNVKYIDQQGWNYGQFEENILDICFDILDNNLNYYADQVMDCSRRGDPIYIGRVVSAMVNSNDDQGVLMGTWSGDYSDGADPITWSGSVDILRTWYKGGYKPVRYGQCWVFAGVMCTVLRCLGIPNRPVTNFVSAHDSEGNLRVQEYYDVSGTILSKSRDSIWTYHVWNEAWLERKDLGPIYNGWQVLDATAQERSEGLYRCGPASVHAVKEGDVALNYDGLFVFAEVNADRVTYICYDDDVMKKVHTDVKMIGQSISTKAVGNDSRIDITHNYKYPEGSEKEREVFEKANKMVPDKSLTEGGINNGAEEDEEPGISVKMKLLKPPVVGQGLHLTLTLINLTPVENTVRVNFSCSSILHNRQPKALIMNSEGYATLDPHEVMTFPLEIPYSEYEKSLTSDNLIEVAAVCEEESGRKLLVRRDISLENPPLVIQVHGNAVVDIPVTVEVGFTNPLSEDGIGCSLVAEGSGLIERQFKKRLPPLKPRESSTVQFNITPSRSGTRQLLVSLTSKSFSSIKGFLRVEVAEAQ
ncbi:protein-glutamine gamma-glutamyltransferase 6-like isoform X2 [Ambystoma mexicanum]